MSIKSWFKKSGNILSTKLSGLNMTLGGNLVVGEGAVGVDYTIEFDGENSDGTITFMEDENEFKLSTNLQIDDSSNSAGLKLLSSNSGIGFVDFGDTDDADVGRLVYDHSSNAFLFYLNTSNNITFTTSNIQLIDSGNNPAITVGDDAVTNYGRLFWDSANDYIRLETNGTNGFKLKGNNSAIGNIYPSYPISIGSGTTETFRVLADGRTYSGDIAGGNYTEIEADGTILFNGNATVFDDIFVGLSTANVPASNFPNWESFVGNLNQFTFALNDFLEMGAVELPHGYKEGSDIEIHVHYATNGLDGTDRTVKWEVEYSIANMNVGGNPSVVFSSSTVVSAEDTIPASTTDLTHRYLNIGTITGTNIKIGANIVSRIRRIASSGTEPSANPFGLMLGFHYEADTIGSRQETTK